MGAGRHRIRRGRYGIRRNLVTVAACLSAVSGAILITVEVAAQKHAPQPPLTAVGSLGSSVSAAIPSVDPSPGAVGPVLPASKPVSVDIPAIGVHSAMQYLGLTAQHTLQVPKPGPHYNEAGWYKYSSTPGSLGPAVIVGHVDSEAQGPSVFFSLGALRPGDNVLVTRADGLVAVFRVDGVRSYPKDHFPTQLVYGETDHAALRLVTCGGAFDQATGHYLDNIVVFASLVGSH